MVFSSTVFLFCFLPLVLAMYFLAPWRSAKNVILLLFSLAFYAWGEPVYILLLVFSIVVNWAGGLAIAHCNAKQTLLAISVAFNVLVLGFFKYESFVATSINRFLSIDLVPDLALPLPIGISFFTLQALTYVVDVYRGACRTQRNILYLGMYISMFPQLVAGPIVRYSQIENEIDNRRVTLEGFAQGIRLFSIGMGKKVLLANVCGTLADSLLAQQACDIGMVGCISAVAAYTFQIYFDFCGYSDMAQGLGRMFGFSYPRNFNYPYIARSATEFWRRWHMSLGAFFRDYLYIPMGGNRVSTPRWVFNIAVVWAITGLWHGAAWNFVLWGLYFGVVLICEKLFLLNFLEKIPRAVQHLYAVIVFMFGWLLFSVSGLENLRQWICGVVGVYGLTGTSTLWELTSWEYVSLLPVLVAACLPIVPALRRIIESWAEGCDGARSRGGNIEHERRAGSKRRKEHGFSFDEVAPVRDYAMIPSCCLQVERPMTPTRARAVSVIGMFADITLLAILVLSCMSLASSSYNPFIYFQF